MSNFIIGTCGHIDHGKTALIKALNGFEGDTAKEEKERGITIDLSFSNIQKDEQNIAFIDVPGHEKLVKNMIAGAFSFDCVLIVVSAAEGIKPQTIEHLEILNLLGVKNAVLVLTKKDLVSEAELKKNLRQTEEFVSKYAFDLKFSMGVSIYDEHSIERLKERLFSLDASTKIEENFFRYYVDRVFSVKGTGTIVTGTVLGKPIKVNEKVFICDIQKESKIKNLQVHSKDAEEANISNRTAINLSGVDAKDIKRGFLIGKKGYLRGFNSIDISFKALKDKFLHHNRYYSVYIGSRKIDAKVLLFNSQDSLGEGFASIKSEEDIFSIYNEKLIIRDGNFTVAGGVVLNPISDPMKKSQKLHLLEALEKKDIPKAYSILLKAHKKGLGLISSAQRFALSHVEALSNAKKLDNCFVDEKELIIYPIMSQKIIIETVRAIYTKNPYALLSVSSLKLRLPWASEYFIETSLKALLDEKFLIKENNLYRSADIKEDLSNVLEKRILERLQEEDIAPTAPYNIYDDLDLDRKSGDSILKSLCSRKEVVRVEHNLFIHAQSLSKMIAEMKSIINEEGFIDIRNFKKRYPLSRKYLIAYLDYLDKFFEIKKENGKRVFSTLP